MNSTDFHAGAEFFAHTWLGAHLTTDGVTFRTYAPSADGVSVRTPAGDTPMQRVDDDGFWEARVPDMGPGDPYTYLITRGDTTCIDRKSVV